MIEYDDDDDNDNDGHVTYGCMLSERPPYYVLTCIRVEKEVG